MKHYLKTICLSVIMFIITIVAAFSQTVNIENKSVHDDATEIAEIIVYEIFEFDTLNLIIIDLPAASSIMGAVVKNKVEPHSYVMLLNQSMSLKSLRLTMSHEFIHVQQYENEGLEIFGDIWVWNPDNLLAKQGVTWGSMTFTGYDNRKFELDAVERELIVNKKLLKIIKNRKRDGKN
jgi:hypothetical protein